MRIRIHGYSYLGCHQAVLASRSREELAAAADIAFISKCIAGHRHPASIPKCDDIFTYLLFLYLLLLLHFLFEDVEQLFFALKVEEVHHVLDALLGAYIVKIEGEVVNVYDVYDLSLIIVILLLFLLLLFLLLFLLLLFFIEENTLITVLFDEEGILFDADLLAFSYSSSLIFNRLVGGSSEFFILNTIM